MKKNRSYSRFKNFLRKLGPGIVTGASDDDPSGIATYTQAGATYGTQLLWTALFTYPLMVNIQEMCARVGIATKQGITGTIKNRYSKPVLYMILLVSIPSITFNIGADIASMGAVGNMIFPTVPAHVFSILFTLLLMYSMVHWSYHKIATVLKWLCIVFFSYLVIPFITKTDWKQALINTILPDIEFSSGYFIALVAILGTTISPYLFFWQATMEVEESKHKKHLILDKKLIADMDTDVKTGMFLTNIVFYFIILASGSVLFSAGTTQVDTVEQAALALKPLAGEFAYYLFALGIMGTGLIAIPVLAGSLSYMLAEAFEWEEGLDKKFHEAKGFYVTMIAALVLGLSMNFIGVSPVKALIYSAVLYGITAPVLIGIILHIANDKSIMKQFVNTRKQNIIGVLTLAIMGIAAVLLLYFEISG